MPERGVESAFLLQFEFLIIWWEMKALKLALLISHDYFLLVYNEVAAVLIGDHLRVRGNIEHPLSFLLPDVP